MSTRSNVYRWRLCYGYQWLQVRIWRKRYLYAIRRKIRKWKFFSVIYNLYHGLYHIVYMAWAGITNYDCLILYYLFSTMTATAWWNRRNSSSFQINDSIWWKLCSWFQLCRIVFEINYLIDFYIIILSVYYVAAQIT